MEKIEEFTARIILPPVTQIGVIVRDMEQAVKTYPKTLGFGPSSPTTDLISDKDWTMGERYAAHLRTSRVMWDRAENRVSKS